MNERLDRLEAQMAILIDTFCGGAFDDSEPPMPKPENPFGKLGDLGINEDDLPPYI